jgi:hypothetical protein
MRVRKYYEKGTGEIKEEVLLSRSEQEVEYDRCLQKVLDDPRWVLDNLESLSEFKVGWQEYGKRRVQPKLRTTPKDL